MPRPGYGTSPLTIRSAARAQAFSPGEGAEGRRNLLLSSWVPVDSYTHFRPGGKGPWLRDGLGMVLKWELQATRTRVGTGLGTEHLSLSGTLQAGKK